jgi:hypothetical protein
VTGAILTRHKEPHAECTKHSKADGPKIPHADENFRRVSVLQPRLVIELQHRQLQLDPACVENLPEVVVISRFPKKMQPFASCSSVIDGGWNEAERRECQAGKTNRKTPIRFASASRTISVAWLLPAAEMSSPFDYDRNTASVSFIGPLEFNRHINPTDTVTGLGDTAYAAPKLKA